MRDGWDEFEDGCVLGWVCAVLGLLIWLGGSARGF